MGGRPHHPRLCARLAITTDQVGAELTLTLTQQNASGKLYGCVVEVEVQGSNGAKALVSFDYGLAPTSPSKSTLITFPEAVSAVVLDPARRLVARKAGPPLTTPTNKLPVWPL